MNKCLSLTDTQKFSSFLLSNFIYKALVCTRAAESRYWWTGVVAHTFNLSTWATGALEFEIILAGLHEFQVSQGYIIHCEILSFFIGLI